MASHRGGQFKRVQCSIMHHHYLVSPWGRLDPVSAEKKLELDFSPLPNPLECDHGHNVFVIPSQTEVGSDSR